MKPTCAACEAEAVVQWRRQSADPDNTDTEPVFSCPDHALPPDAAAYVHKASCMPGSDDTCDCPQPPPEFPFTEDEQAPERRLPAGW